MVIVTGLSYTQYIGAGLVEEGMMLHCLAEFWVSRFLTLLTSVTRPLRHTASAHAPLRLCLG